MTEVPQLVIISGLSGSGKTVALHTLEDTGYYCIDNLPVSMLAAYGRHIRDLPTGDQTPHAVGIDARNRPDDLKRFDTILQELRDQGIRARIVFLTADETTLIKRFSETRRRHPLSGKDIPLADAIGREHHLLTPIQSKADLVIDTTATTIHQLRELVRKRLARTVPGLSILFQSFGFKHGIPGDADFVFDVRCLPNPHWEPTLRPLTGKDPEVVDYLEEQPEVIRMGTQIREFLSEWIPHFERENRSYLTVAIGCTGGQHRSVYLAEMLGAYFRRRHGQHVTVRHRELS